MSKQRVAQGVVSDAGRIELSVLKGLIEHGDTAAYFASLIGHAHWRERTAARGWIEQGGDHWRVTDIGHRVYLESGVGDLAPKHYGMRWYGWNWAAVRVPPPPGA